MTLTEKGTPFIIYMYQTKGVFMERQQLEPLTEMVENKKKKRKSVLTIVLGIIGSLLAVIAIAGFFIY